jgi:hypothetical protein
MIGYNKENCLDEQKKFTGPGQPTQADGKDDGTA